MWTQVALTSEWNQSGLYLELEFPSVRMKFLFLSHPVYSVLLYHPACNQTPGKCVSVLRTYDARLQQVFLVYEVNAA